ncbi:hypothetical protein SKAU_G00191360 [Synaphobranchus kaupii]|uniref:DUF6729 domain-containing protein n=1 Tax=Synaphobranchus kaupii TaxID=118154 RepID=A0A9Q1FDS4_SYNKA|nr:hypothetical protein SKAU_G00191360 [Synaphobranchus kaupii]
MKKFNFFPGRMEVSFRKGPSGHLRQDPSEEARRIKDNPSLQDKSAALKEEVVMANARKVVLQRGGDVSDKLEVLGEFTLQFGKYKGKSFRWLLENYVGYSLYLINKVEKEEEAGQFNPVGHSKDSLLSFLQYCRGFKELKDLRRYLAERPAPAAVETEVDNLVGFGARAKATWGEIWKSRADGFAAFILRQRCVPNSKMHRLQQYLMKQQSQLSSPVSNSHSVPTTQTATSTTTSNPPDSPARPSAAATSVPLPTVSSAPAQLASVPSYDQEVSKWNCSLHQRIWMKTELEALGLWPGSRPVRHHMNMVSLWRHPPQPELIDSISELPSPKYFQLHPFFIWKPEHAIMERLRNNYILPCLYGCPSPQVLSAGVGRPRVIVGTSGQYYIFASRLNCKMCKRYWFADKPQWLEMLPYRLSNILPAFLTHKKAICKTVMDELRRTGKSPNDMANQVNELLHLKYERANLAYLLAVQNVRDAEAGLYGQKTITGFLHHEDSPAPFGNYEDTDGWYGVSVSSHYLTECLLQEYKRQEPVLNLLLQGTFGQVFRSDHTRRLARKVTLSSGTMSSYAIMNENWMILSWVMLQSECDKSLEPMYDGLAHRYNSAGVEKAKYQWVDRFTRECVSEHHPLYSTFCKFLSAAFSVVDQDDLQKLKDAYTFCGIVPANPTKQHIREHCRTKVPHPKELVKRVEDVLHHFHLTKDPNGILLFKPSMLKEWRIQRVHILRGCLSDPEGEDGTLYHYGGTLQLNHVQGEGATVPIWIPVRGTSQQEGFHCHQARWVTGNQVSTNLFQAQGMTGVARWNFQRLLDLKQPDVVLPKVFDPVLIAELNRASERVMGAVKYPALHLSVRDTGERFGLQYLEPGCGPVPLDWDKHKSQKTTPPPPPPPLPVAVKKEQPSVQPRSSPPVVFHFPPAHHTSDARKGDTSQESCDISELPAAQTGLQCNVGSFMDTDLQKTPPLPMAASPRATRTGPIKTGGLVFVLDHNRWPVPMRAAIDELLAKHRGAKDLLVRVDADYAALMHSCRGDPNSLLHPTTKQHISRYIKYLAKQTNASTSLNTSPEKLQESQQLWQCLTAGSQTVSVPVTTLPPALVNPPAPATPLPEGGLQEPPLSQAAVEKMVREILEKQQGAMQQQQQQQQLPKRTRNCLACGQPKSRYLGDGSSIHFFYQMGEVKYFYCSTKVFQTYAAEGLTNPRMPFQDFADTESDELCFRSR